MAVKRFLSLTLCVPVLAAACGGGGGTLTKAQYAARLSQICRVASHRVDELHLDYTVASWKADGRRLDTIESDFKNSLAALEPPASIRRAVAAYTQAADRTGRTVAAAVAAADAGDAARFHAAIKRGDKEGRPGWRYAKMIGAKGCYLG